MAADTLSIRRATPADAELIAAFNQAMAAETEGRRLDGATLAAGVRAVLREPARGVYYLAERSEGLSARGGAVVGQLLLTYEWSDWRNGWFWWIQSVYVAPAARGGGVYRKLHEHVAALARAAGDVCGVRLYVDAGNAAAQAVYRRLGMTVTNYRLFETDWSGAAHNSHAAPDGTAR
ncbi:MAG: GNAT family N-acetyltransferase [Phycisphaerae bacterium]|nr:GNAT family N-acetyltransferase [Phycisphaerae bacterium]MCZ2401097.1 GNAT family N-acetyltransferase [Phycisphaerae bacterium]